MGAPHSDALVFFGATGDLAHKKIFPALQAMVKHGHLDVPVIGVAKAGWDLDRLRRGRATASNNTAASTRRPSPSSAACSATSTATTTTRRPSQALRKELGAAQHPAHYLAIPPDLVRHGRRAARELGSAPRVPGSSSRSRSAATSPRRRR